MANPQVIAVIPARGGSKRLPRKNVRVLWEIPLIAYPIHAALSADFIDTVLVSTDNDEIADVARKWGAEIVERPVEISRDTSPIDEALRHALQFWHRKANVAPEMLVWLQADVPIHKPGMIDRVVQMLRTDGNASAVATGYRVSEHPSWMKTMDADGYMYPLEPSMTTYRLQDLPDLFLLDGAIMAMRPDNLENDEVGLHVYLGEHPRLLVQEHPMYSLNVETMEQMEIAQFHLERHPELVPPRI